MAGILAEWAPAALVAHASVLLVVFTLLASGVAAFMPNGRLAWLIAVAATGLSLLCAVVLADAVAGGAVVSYELGGWAPPIGIEFRVDGLNALFLFIVTGIAFLAAIFSWPTVEAEVRAEQRPLFYTAYLICVTGLSGVAITGDAFNMFVFLEISSISTYVLVAMGARRDRRALPAAFNYLIMGTIGATFFVIGVGFLYAATGTLNMDDMSSRLPSVYGSRTVLAGFAFIMVGLALKAAVWPLHQWLPNAYAYAPSFVTVFLSATATKVAIYALIRFLFSVFSADFSYIDLNFGMLFAALAAAAMVACSFQAAFQTDVRRTLAYSSVAQVGYIILGVSLGTAAGLSAGLLHLFNHALMKGALFMAVAGVVLSFQGARIKDFAGLGRVAPFTTSAFAVAGISLIGVPLTAGFQSKIALLNAVLEQGWWWAAFVIVGSSVLAVVYVGRILEVVFFRAPANPRKTRKEAPLLLLVPLWALALANIWIGVDASFPIGLADQAAAALGLETAP